MRIRGGPRPLHPQGHHIDRNRPNVTSADRDSVHPTSLSYVSTESCDMSMREPIEIDGESGLYYAGEFGSHDERFVAAFRSTWCRIPSEDRSKMISWWQWWDGQLSHQLSELYRLSGRVGEMPHAKRTPTIEVLDKHPSWGNAVAMSHHFGSGMSFRRVVVDVIPDQLLEVLIAHELGHCFLHSLSRLDFSKFPIDSEVAVFRQLRRWGFHERKLDNWLEKNRSLVEAQGQ